MVPPASAQSWRRSCRRHSARRPGLLTWLQDAVLRAAFQKCCRRYEASEEYHHRSREGQTTHNAQLYAASRAPHSPRGTKPGVFHCKPNGRCACRTVCGRPQPTRRTSRACWAITARRLCTRPLCRARRRTQVITDRHHDAPTLRNSRTQVDAVFLTVAGRFMFTQMSCDRHMRVTPPARSTMSRPPRVCRAHACTPHMATTRQRRSDPP